MMIPNVFGQQTFCEENCVAKLTSKFFFFIVDRRMMIVQVHFAENVKSLYQLPLIRGKDEC